MEWILAWQLYSPVSDSLRLEKNRILELFPIRFWVLSLFLIHWYVIDGSSFSTPKTLHVREYCSPASGPGILCPPLSIWTVTFGTTEIIKVHHYKLIYWQSLIFLALTHKKTTKNHTIHFHVGRFWFCTPTGASSTCIGPSMRLTKWKELKLALYSRVSDGYWIIVNHRGAMIIQPLKRHGAICSIYVTLQEVIFTSSVHSIMSDYNCHCIEKLLIATKVIVQPGLPILAQRVWLISIILGTIQQKRPVGNIALTSTWFK